MNFHAVKAIYRYEMARMFRTVVQSIVAPVLSTSLYFVIFGSAIGSRITEIDGVSYGSFIVPGLIMMSIMTESISNSSFAIYFPKFTGTIYEVLSAPVSYGEVVLGYVGAPIGYAHLPAADLRFVLPVRLYPGYLGDGLGKADDRSDSGHHAADLSWRYVLLNVADD